MEDKEIYLKSLEIINNQITNIQTLFKNRLLELNKNIEELSNSQIENYTGELYSIINDIISLESTKIIINWVLSDKKIQIDDYLNNELKVIRREYIKLIDEWREGAK